MRKTQKERFYVAVHVMPYVQRYMTDNYGVRDTGIKNLVDISRDPLLMSEFLPRLRKAEAMENGQWKMDRGGSAIAKRRTGVVNIGISQTTFERQGWELSPRDEAAVALLLERRCQGLLLAFLQVDYILTGDLAESIRHFYRLFRQTEETWPTDSIRKLWLRNVPQGQRRTLHGLLERENMKIFMRQLSGNGTITKQGLRRYADEL